MTVETQPAVLNHRDLAPAIAVTARHPDLTAEDLLARVRPALGALSFPSGVGWSTGGEIAENAVFACMPYCLAAMALLRSRRPSELRYSDRRVWPKN